MKKKVIAVTLAGALVLSSVSMAFAAPGKGNGQEIVPPGQAKKAVEQAETKAGGPPTFVQEKLIDKFTVIDGKRIKVKGNHVNFDVPPVIKEGRTLIPVRAVTEGLGAEVGWDPQTSTVTITKGDKVIVLVLGSDEVLVNGVIFVIEVPAGLINNRTFVPLRLIAEALGEKVKYNDETGEIEIGDEEEIDEEVDEEVEEVDEELDEEVDEELDEEVDEELDEEVEEEADEEDEETETQITLE